MTGPFTFGFFSAVMAMTVYFGLWLVIHVLTLVL